MDNSNGIEPTGQPGSDGGDPPLIVEVGGAQIESCPISDFDAAAMAELTGRLMATSAEVIIDITGIVGWLATACWLVFQMAKAVGSRVRFRVSQRIHTPFEGMLAAIADVSNLDACARSLRAAIEAAAVFHPDVPDQAAERIRDRFRELGSGALRVTTIAKRIRELAGGGAGSESDDPAGLAARFIGHLRDLQQLTGDQFPLRYYRDGFYLFDATKWSAISDMFLICTLTNWLQRQRIAAVGNRVIADVVVNLKGMVMIREDWSTEMPFWISDGNATGAPGAYLSFANGLVLLTDLLSGAPPLLHPHDRRWFVQNSLPFPYDPNATCPGWEAFLNQVLPVTSDVDRRQQVLQAAISNCILSNNGFEKFVVLVGNGSNGKSVVLRVLSALLGKGNVEHISYDQLTNEFRLESLVGKWANITMELNHLSKANEALLRSIISGESITINRKFKTAITVTLRAKLLAATNELPTFSDSTDAIWRRLVIIPFNVLIPAADANHNLVAELCEELPGIFNWMVSGLGQLNADNDFPTCSLCSGARNRLREESDPVREFVAECCVADPTAQPIAQELYDLFVSFCIARQRKVLASNQFGMRLCRRGIPNVRVGPAASRQRCYRGLRLRPQAQWLIARTRARIGDNWHGLTYITA